MAERTRAELVAALRRADAAGDAKAAAAIARKIKAMEAKPKQKPKSFWQGFAEGVMPAAYNAAKLMNYVDPVRQIANIATGGALDRSVDKGRQQTKRRLANTGYQGSTAGNTTGSVIGTLPTLAIPGAGYLGAIGQGAAGGALLSEDILDPSKAGPDAALGAVTGGLVKFGADKVLAPGLRAMANSAPGRAALNAARLPKLTNAPKLTKVERVVRRAKPDFGDARVKIEEAQALGLPYVAADASVPLRDLAGAARRHASPGVVDDAAEFASGRMVDRSTRGLSAIERDFGRVIDPEATGEQIVKTANRRAGPLYDEVFDNPVPVWSPRLQQFLDDPIVKDAYKEGVDLQRLDAVARGVEFDPTDLSVTQFNDAGEPILSSVPNMRTLDAIKRGLDRQIEAPESINSVTGRMNSRGRSYSQFLKSYRDELDAIRPEYAAARGEYEKFIKRKTAMDLGMKAAQPSVEARNVARQIEGMDPKQRAMYERGFVTENVDALRSARSDTANPYDYLAGGLDRKDKLATLFPETTPQFLRQRQFEKDMAATSQELFGGSPTQIRKANDDAFKSAAMDTAADVGLDVIATGGALTPGTVASMLRKIKGNEGLGLLGAREKADALLPLLTSPNAGQEFQAMSARLLADEAQREAYRKAMGLLVAPTTAGLLSF